MMGMCQQQLMGVCQQLKVCCSQNCASRGVGAHVASDLYPMSKWLCKCTFVGLGVNKAPVRPFTWLCKCNIVGPGSDTAENKGNSYVFQRS